jgi:hypothetical protein
VAFFSQYTSRADSSTVNITTPQRPYAVHSLHLSWCHHHPVQQPIHLTPLYSRVPRTSGYYPLRTPDNTTQHQVAIWVSDAWKSRGHAGACSFWYTTLTAQRSPQLRLWGRWRHSMGLLGTLGFLIFPASRAKGTCRRRMD